MTLRSAFSDEIFTKKIVKFNEDNGYEVKNWIEVSDRLKQINDVDENEIWCSFDVFSFFINVSVKLDIKFINHNWAKIVNNTVIKSKLLYLEGINIILDNGCFILGQNASALLFTCPRGVKPFRCERSLRQGDKTRERRWS